MNQRNELGHEKILNLLIKYSIPATIGMFVNALYNIVDRIFIGNANGLGSLGIGGITLLFPIVIILMAFAIMCGVGGATLYSINAGQKNYSLIPLIIGNSFALTSIIALFTSIILYFNLENILILLGASQNTLPFALEYARIILLGAIFQGINMTGNNLIRADGSPAIAMASICIGAIVNIILDYILIFKFNMGMGGAALATIIGQACSTIWVLLYFTKGQANYKLQLKNLVISIKLAFNIIITGLPAFIVQIATSILNIVLNKTLFEYGGDNAIASMGIINSVQTLMLMPIIGINQGSLPIIGFNYGALNYERIKKTVLYSAFLATIMATTGYLLVRLFPTQIISLFSKDPIIINQTKVMFKYIFYFMPLFGIQMITSNFFQGIRKVRLAIILSMTRQIILLIPLIIILSNAYGYMGILYASPFADIIAISISITCIILTLKKLKVTLKSSRG
ncbi:MAG: MATE family efflux transporter [Bacilli bacterium]